MTDQNEALDEFTSKIKGTEVNEEYTNNMESEGVVNSGEEFNESFRMPFIDPDSAAKGVFKSEVIGPADEILNRLDEPLPEREKSFRKAHREKELNLVCSGILAERFKKIMKEKHEHTTDNLFLKKIGHESWTPVTGRIKDGDGFWVNKIDNVLDLWINDKYFHLPSQSMCNCLEAALDYAHNTLATLYSNQFRGNRSLFLFVGGYLDDQYKWTSKAKRLRIIKNANKYIEQKKKERDAARKESADAARKRKEKKIEKREKWVARIRKGLKAAFFGATKPDKTEEEEMEE